jgi:hypothetical protein
MSNMSLNSASNNGKWINSQFKFTAEILKFLKLIKD